MDYGSGIGFPDDMMAQQMENQQFMEQQMWNQQMMQEQTMMNQQQMMNHMVMMPQIMFDRYGNPKIHKKQALEMLRYELQTTTGCYITKEYKIEETPNMVRHCCVQSGISQLPKYEYPVPALGVTIPYYFCKSCGTLFLCDEML